MDTAATKCPDMLPLLAHAHAQGTPPEAAVMAALDLAPGEARDALEEEPRI